MNTPPAKPLLTVMLIAAVAAAPLGLALDGGRPSALSFLSVAGAALAAAAWLTLLVASGAVQRLGFWIGGLVGFLSLSTVLLVIFSMPAAPGATGTLTDRAFWVGILLYGFGPYAFAAGGIVGLALRRMPLRHAA